MSRLSQVAVIIVTHNSQKYIEKCIRCLQEQTSVPEQIIIVDSGSQNCDYLKKYSVLKQVKIILGKPDIGFCAGNNLGMAHLNDNIEFVLFLNPDAFLTPSFIEKGVKFMEKKCHQKCGALTGKTLGYCIEKDLPTGLYDTTGIFHSWWGKWYDRGQGEIEHPQKYTSIESIPAICGAVYFCRYQAIQEAFLSKGHRELFDTQFYMYKEDIDLSLRLRKLGWKLMFVPELIAYHCRGWNTNRKAMPQAMRLYSAINELRIHWRQKSPIPLLYSCFKYCAVKYLNR